MNTPHIAIQGLGLVTSVGLDAPASCAAFRGKIGNPTQTRYIDSAGEPIMAHQVPLAQPWVGPTRLAKMAAMSMEEALRDLPRKEWGTLPMLLCVAEAERPGRMEGLDEALFNLIQAELGVTFAARSMVITQGRVAVAVALAQARALITQGHCKHVLVVAADSLLNWPTMGHYERVGRLLTSQNTNGFMPGEGAGALLVGQAQGQAGELVCTGLGFSREPAHLDSEAPLRADGLSQAIKAAMNEAGRQIHDMDFRITDVSGEQYYFKEAALALSRTMRVLKEAFDIWHPAECMGEAGAAAGVAVVALAQAACRKGYAPGPNVLAHMANDAGQRAALSLQYRVAR
ncbi:3-oxoacyl-ACP synthase [Aquabacterium sp. NJ1]|uniref:beta-ketoacyl synthase N-terminal-like domain-containing protein n=1 Tax=Aquabacterium sp. NJ1 TaxID=1538295 RepID=UPI00052D53A6|nr:beta-ketoacyl synthase N-terminal-like domain-containing protein [Aquabacterium sp. NJ1]KGM40339.1 3-oxoacyl-ACP synthase [Aquabacterium sp. NJ1]